ncbi:MAG: AAC(3) family N-acetyltransferase [Defluviitaleaceae bacterium]|nr:AAC(3) family N-acetyltransferase [Defluviitaleaceae bacterium]
MNKIVTDLRNLGIMPDDTLLVHSSLKSLGWVEGGAETVIKALIAALPTGNLLMPALTYEYVRIDTPIFSMADTPSCVGTIPETFRKFPGVIRSVHPTHSVCAYGINAEEITARHHLDRTPVGENSPFRQMMKYGGKIMMLGCGLMPNTFMHGVEEATKVPYILESTPTKLIVNGVEVFHYKHHFGSLIQRYDRVTEVCEITQGKVLEAEVFIIDAQILWDTATKKVSGEPWFFVSKP